MVYIFFLIKSPEILERRSPGREHINFVRFCFWSPGAKKLADHFAGLFVHSGKQPLFLWAFHGKGSFLSQDRASLIEKHTFESWKIIFFVFCRISSRNTVKSHFSSLWLEMIFNPQTLCLSSTSSSLFIISLNYKKHPYFPGKVTLLPVSYPTVRNSLVLL